ncbi:MAG: zinc ribbon domain-containing protein [Deltaproteobacteria bacterium]|nr:zinc ribbon domain-containing protein [Deltaproteobacteria bacterium]
MPIYEFRCERCSEEFEELVPSGTESHPCPKCGCVRSQRLASAAAFSVGGKMTTSSSSSGCSSCSTSSCSGCSCGGH